MVKAVEKIRFSLACVSLMVAGVGYAKIDLETCVGVWLFDEGKGNVASDSCENGSDGKIHGGAKWVNGKLGGKALRLDGKDDYVEIAHHDSLTFGEKHTIALWFKLDEVPAGGTAVVTKDDWAPGFWWNGATIRHHTYDPLGTLHFIDAPWKPDTDWHHIAVTWDGKEFGIYLDADQIGSDVTTPDLGRRPLTDNPLLIGIYGQHGQWGKFFSGIIDEVAIFNIALADDDIETIMAKGLEEILSVEPSDKLAAIWATIKAQ